MINAIAREDSCSVARQEDPPLEITTLAAWGEFIGGIGVIVSLIYLASQIRQNSKLLRSSTASSTTASQTDTGRLVVQDSDVARIYWDGMADRPSLSQADLRRFDALLGIQFTHFHQEYRLAADGVIAPGVWTSRTRGMGWMLQQPSCASS